MLIESSVVNFSEVKRCLSSLQIDDFIVVSENIFALTEAPQPPVHDQYYNDCVNFAVGSPTRAVQAS